MRAGPLERFVHPDARLRTWARARTFAGTSKPRSLYICGVRRKTFYILSTILSLIILAIVLGLAFGITHQIKRAKASRLGLSPNGARTGVTLPGGRVLVPTTTRIITTIVTSGTVVTTMESHVVQGITYTFPKQTAFPTANKDPQVYSLTVEIVRVLETVSGGSTSYIDAFLTVEGGSTITDAPSTTVLGGETITNALTTITIDDTTNIESARTTTESGGTTTRLPTTFTTAGIISNQPAETIVQGATTKILSPSTIFQDGSTVTTSAAAVINGGTTIIQNNGIVTINVTTLTVGSSTKVYGGFTFSTIVTWTYTGIHTIGPSLESSAASMSSVLVYKAPRGGVIVLPLPSNITSRYVWTY